MVGFGPERFRGEGPDGGPRPPFGSGPDRYREGVSCPSPDGCPWHSDKQVWIGRPEAGGIRDHRRRSRRSSSAGGRNSDWTATTPVESRAER